jgi:hypothetical protein
MLATPAMVGSRASRSTKNPRKPRNKRFPDFRGRRSKRLNRQRFLSLRLRSDLKGSYQFMICWFTGVRTDLGKEVI